MAVTVFAHDFVADVLHRRTKFILTVWALSVEGLDDDRRRVIERFTAVFALHLHVAVLRMNAQFLTATGATDIMTFWRCRGDHGKLRQGYKQRDLDAVFRQFQIQQRATGATMDYA